MSEKIKGINSVVTEINVTPEMVSAAVKVLEENADDGTSDPMVYLGNIIDLMPDILRAAISVRRDNGKT